MERELIEWKSARKAFLELPAGHADTREALNRLANAEDALFLLPEPSHEQGGPVAWHTTDIRGRIAETTDFASVADAWREQGYTARPLYASPQPAVSRVTDAESHADYVKRIVLGGPSDVQIRAAQTAAAYAGTAVPFDHMRAALTAALSQDKGEG